MINLLPPEGKSLVKREYWTRVLSLWGLLLGIVAICGAFFLTPSLVLIKLQLSTVETDLQKRGISGDEFEEKERAIRETNAIVEQLSLPEPNSRISEIITDIADTGGAGVTLNHFEFTVKDRAVTGAQIRGLAKKREQLAAFKIALERVPLFASVTLPISDLAREVDVPFAIAITLRSETP